MVHSLIDDIDGLVCDLDGVVYRGGSAVDGAAETLLEARRRGVGVVFATNNASRPPERVAEILAGLGMPAEPTQVLTSAVTGARVLAEELPSGASVLAVGGPGVAAALRASGLCPIDPADAADRDPVAVLQGYGSQVSASDLAEAAYAVERGARWIATNADETLPTDRGIAPGNGTLVGAVARAVGREPQVVGKPGPLMYDQAAADLGAPAARILGVGDRLETDIAGAHAAGIDAVHVLTGVHTGADLVTAPGHLRPRYVGADLRTLLEAYDPPEPAGADRWSIGAVTGTLDTRERPTVRYEHPRDAAPSPVVALRLALAVLWDAQDRGRLTGEEAVAALPPEAVA